VGWTLENKRCVEETQAPNKHIDPLNLRLDSAAGMLLSFSIPWFTLSSRMGKHPKISDCELLDSTIRCSPVVVILHQASSRYLAKRQKGGAERYRPTVHDPRLLCTTVDGASEEPGGAPEYEMRPLILWSP
jgi:hypothetical protein